MRKIIIGLVVAVLGIGVWIGLAAWRWSTIDTQAVFRARIDAEALSGTRMEFAPDSIIVGDLGEAAKLVCGTVSRIDAAGGRSDATYSLVVIKTLFGYRINDGYTPATRPDNQAMSDQNCAALRAHAASHALAGHG